MQSKSLLKDVHSSPLFKHHTWYKEEYPFYPCELGNMIFEYGLLLYIYIYIYILYVDDCNLLDCWTYVKICRNMLNI